MSWKTGLGSGGERLELYRVRRVRRQQHTTEGEGCRIPAEGEGGGGVVEEERWNKKRNI